MIEIRAVRLGGLGDLLAVLPSLRLLRRAFPERRIVLRCRREYGSLLLERGVVDAVVPVETEDPDPEGEDARIGWFQSGSSVPSGPGRFFVFDPAAGVPIGRQFFAATTEFVRISGLAEEPDFDSFSRLPSPALRPRNGPVLVHPGSGGARKRWPLERFLALAADLSRRGYGGRIVIGDAEEMLAAEIRRRDLPARWESVESPGLSALAVMLESAPLYVGNDSGITHLAAACGAPVVAVFRTENAVPWRPAGRAAVLAADEVDGVPLERVLEAAAAAIGPRGAVL